MISSKRIRLFIRSSLVYSVLPDYTFATFCMTPSPLDPKIAAEPAATDDRLDSWKEIANFLKKDPRTAQRWERERGLPVHRYPGDKSGGVFAYKSEIKAWWLTDLGSQTQSETPLFEEEEEIVIEPPFPVDHHDWKKLLVMMVTAVLLVCAIYAGVRIYRGIVESQHQKIKVMVRNLQNLTSGSAEDAFSQGMTDQLITDLGGANPEQLGVLARTTANLYSKKTVAELRALGVDYVIEGSVFRDQDRIRINTQLIETRDGTQISSKSYEGDSKNILDLQRAAADDVVRSLKIPVKSKSLSRQVNPAAYEAYMRGQYAWNQRGQYSVANSLGYFQNAVKLDPNYAPAYAALANAYALLASAQYGILPPVEAFGKAKEYAQHGVELDPELAAPHASLGYIELVFDRNPEAARQQFERALRLDPNYVTAHQWYGQYYEVVGKLDEALREIQRAYDQEPGSIPVNLALAEVYYFKRDFDKAIEHAKNTVQEEPTSALGHFNLGRAFEMKGMHEEALAEFKLARENAPNIATLVPLGYEYARAGDMDASKQYLDQLYNLAVKQHKYVPAIYFALVYVGRNDKQNALTWLEKANAERCEYIVFLSRDPMVDSVRGDPRFDRVTQLQAH